MSIRKCCLTDIPLDSVFFSMTAHNCAAQSMKQRDPRIHFALVCGAKSCPPIKVGILTYDPPMRLVMLVPQSAALLLLVAATPRCHS